VRIIHRVSEGLTAKMTEEVILMIKH